MVSVLPRPHLLPGVLASAAPRARAHRRATTMASQLVARAAATSGAAVAAAGYAYFRELASEDDAPFGSTSEGPSRARLARCSTRARRETHPRLRRVLPRRRPLPAPSTPRPRQPPPGTSLASPPPRRRNLAGRERGRSRGGQGVARGERDRGRARRTIRRRGERRQRRVSAIHRRERRRRRRRRRRSRAPLLLRLRLGRRRRVVLFPLGRRPPSRPRPRRRLGLGRRHARHASLRARHAPSCAPRTHTLARRRCRFEPTLGTIRDGPLRRRRRAGGLRRHSRRRSEPSSATSSATSSAPDSAPITRRHRRRRVDRVKAELRRIARGADDPEATRARVAALLRARRQRRTPPRTRLGRRLERERCRRCRVSLLQRCRVSTSRLGATSHARGRPRRRRRRVGSTRDATSSSRARSSRASPPGWSSPSETPRQK